jgi:GR25 family glycosyltransferase involved in LPS biosynthesis
VHVLFNEFALVGTVMLRFRSYGLKLFWLGLVIVATINIASLGFEYNPDYLQLPLKAYKNLSQKIPLVNGKNSTTTGLEQNFTITANSTYKAIVDTDFLFEAAANSTLGFQSIQYINLPTGHDREDAIRMQSYASGLKTTHFDAIGTDLINPDGRGLPPSSGGKPLMDGEKACLRSHAELWNKMIEENIQTMLILEADASWDKNIRQIHKRIAKGYYHLYKTHNPNSTFHPTHDDPYNMQSWEVFSFGTCHDSKKNMEQHVLIHDPDAPTGQKWYGNPLYDQRVVRKSGYLTCTTGYAVTLQAAKKLVLRTSLDMNRPVDLLMGDMISAGEIQGVAVFPPTVAQWAYVEGIGADNLGSVIQNKTSGNVDKAKEIWSQIKKTKLIWSYKKSFRHAAFRNSAFKAFKEMAFGEQ